MSRICGKYATRMLSPTVQVLTLPKRKRSVHGAVLYNAKVTLTFMPVCRRMVSEGVRHTCLPTPTPLTHTHTQKCMVAVTGLVDFGPCWTNLKCDTANIIIIYILVQTSAAYDTRYIEGWCNVWHRSIGWIDCVGLLSTHTASPDPTPLSS